MADSIKLLLTQIVSICEQILTKLEEPKEQQSNPPSDKEPMLPAPRPNYQQEVVIDAIKALKQLKIVGLSEKTCLTWPYREAPEALQLLASAIGLNPYMINWITVIPQNLEPEQSPFGLGLAVQLANHHVVYDK